MSDKLFNAELRDCARVDEKVSIFEHHRRAMEAAEKRTYTEEEIAMYERTIKLDAEDLASAQGEAFQNDQDDYGDELDEHDLQIAQAEWEAEQDEPFGFMAHDDPDYWA